VPQAWSIGVELTFYAIAPFVCRRWQHVAGLLAFGLLVRFVVAHIGLLFGDPWTYRFAPSEMVLFAAGGLAYFAGRKFFPNHPGITHLACGAALSVLVFIIFRPEIVEQFIWTRFGGYDPLFMFYNWPVLVVMVIAVGPLFYGLGRNKFDRMLGELSYPMYICHILISGLLHQYSPETGSTFYVFCVIALSAVLMFPNLLIDKRRKRFGASVPTEQDTRLRPQERGGVMPATSHLR
jgi:peptidoglycan/LPS O-acetylase OafA/YrhL